MSRREQLRASDADRERVAELLRSATVEGRLLAEELEHRLESAFSARTYGELDTLVADLPAETTPSRRPPGPVARLRTVPPVALVVAIPILFALIIAAFVVIASLAVVWAIAIAIGWWVFGHNRNRAYHIRAARSMHSCRRMPGSRPGGASARGFWL